MDFCGVFCISMDSDVKLGLCGGWFRGSGKLCLFLVLLVACSRSGTQNHDMGIPDDSLL